MLFQTNAESFSFIPKKIFFKTLSISKQKSFVYWPNFQRRFWTYQCVDDDHYYDDLTIFRPDVKYHRDSDVQLGDDCDGYYYVKIEYLNPPL